MRWTKEEKDLLIKNYAKDGPKVISKLIGKNYKTVTVMAHKLRIKAPFNKNSVSIPRISLETRALIIEDFVCLHMSLKELSVKYKVNHVTVSMITRRYFKYMGPNKEVLVLQSKV